MTRVIAASGGFDPLHIGHVRYLQEARALGDELVVILNTDAWLQKKKGYAFMPQEERKEVLLALSCVDRVVFSHHTQDTQDMSVSKDLERLQPHVFANGGDRKSNTVPEVQCCARLGIKMEFNVGRGGKVQSSSELVERARAVDPTL